MGTQYILHVHGFLRLISVGFCFIDCFGGEEGVCVENLYVEPASWSFHDTGLEMRMTKCNLS